MTFQAADAQHLQQFDDNSFNVTTCILGLMFMPDHKSALQEAYRVLQPGGIYMASVWGTLPEFQAGQVCYQLPCDLVMACIMCCTQWCPNLLYELSAGT